MSPRDRWVVVGRWLGRILIINLSYFHSSSYDCRLIISTNSINLFRRRRPSYFSTRDPRWSSFCCSPIFYQAFSCLGSHLVSQVSPYGSLSYIFASYSFSTGVIFSYLHRILLCESVSGESDVLKVRTYSYRYLTSLDLYRRHRLSNIWRWLHAQ